MRSKEKRLIKDTAVFMIGKIGSRLTQFFLVPLYTYTLTTSQFGITEIIITVTSLLMPVFSISIADGLLRYGLDNKYNKSSVLKCSLMLVGFGTVFSILCIPLFQINGTIREWLPAFMLILNLRIYRDVFAINLKIKNMNKLFAADSILYTFLLCIISIIFLAYFKMGIKGYFCAYIIANIISILMLTICGNVPNAMHEGRIDSELLISLTKYSVPLIVNGIAWWITNVSDRLMLDFYLTESDVGIYSVAAKLPSLVTSFTSVFNQAWLISSVVEYDSEKEKKFYSDTFRKFYTLLFFSTSILICIIRPFMVLYVSKDYYSAWKYSIVLICSATYSSIATFTAAIYAATKKNVNVTVTTVVGAVANIVLNAILIPRIGIMGASIATYFSWMLITIIRLIDVYRFFSFYINVKKLLFYGVLSVIQCVAVLMLDYYSYVVSVCAITILLFLERDNISNVFSRN